MKNLCRSPKVQGIQGMKGDIGEQRDEKPLPQPKRVKSKAPRLPEALCRNLFEQAPRAPAAQWGAAYGSNWVC